MATAGSSWRPAEHSCCPTDLTLDEWHLFNMMLYIVWHRRPLDPGEHWYSQDDPEIGDVQLASVVNMYLTVVARILTSNDWADACTMSESDLGTLDSENADWLARDPLLGSHAASRC